MILGNILQQTRMVRSLFCNSTIFRLINFWEKKKSYKPSDTTKFVFGAHTWSPGS